MTTTTDAPKEAPLSTVEMSEVSDDVSKAQGEQKEGPTSRGATRNNKVYSLVAVLVLTILVLLALVIALPIVLTNKDNKSCSSQDAKAAYASNCQGDDPDDPCGLCTLQEESFCVEDNDPDELAGLLSSATKNPPPKECYVPPKPAELCDTECQFINGMRGLVIAGVSAIPDYGPLVKGVIETLWGESGLDPYKEAIKYVDTKIVALRSEVYQVLLDLILASAMKDGRDLVYLLDSSDSSTGTTREGKLNNIVGDHCTQALTLFQDGSTGKDRLTPLERLPVIARVGYGCISLSYLAAYHFKDVTGLEQTEDGLKSIRERDLEDYIGNFTQLATQAREEAIKLTFLSHFKMKDRHLMDWRCPSAYGPPHGGRGHTVTFPSFDNCRLSDNFKHTHIALQQMAFEDGLLVYLDAYQVDLWKYYLPKNVKSGNQPTRILKTATSNSHLNIRYSNCQSWVSRGYHKKAYKPADGVDPIVIKSVTLQHTAYFSLSGTRGGNLYEVPPMYTTQNPSLLKTFELKENEIIIAVDTRFETVKTAYTNEIDGNITEGRILSAALHPDPSPNWLLPPPGTYGGNFYPRLVDVVGYWGYEEFLMPVWQYETHV